MRIAKLITVVVGMVACCAGAYAGQLELTSEIVNPKKAPSQFEAQLQDCTATERPDGTYLVKGRFVAWAVSRFTHTNAMPSNVDKAVAGLVKEGCPSGLANSLRDEVAAGSYPNFMTSQKTMTLFIPKGVKVELTGYECYGRRFFIALKGDETTKAEIKERIPLISSEVQQSGKGEPRVTTTVSYSEADLADFKRTFKEGGAAAGGAAVGALIGKVAGTMQ